MVKVYTHLTHTYGLGSIIPYADWSRVKYNCTGTYRMASLVELDKLIPFSGSLTAEAQKLIKAALSRSTWAKYSSAWNAYAKFENTVGKNFSWPLEEDVIRGFATWCISTRKLSTSTAKAYIAALATAHQLAGMQCIKPSKLTQLILAGGKNLEH